MITKNINKFLVAGMMCCALGPTVTSCSDMLENDNSRQVFDPSLGEKTDSVFYVLGMLQGMQELADQYVFQGEMRGDLTATTPYTDNNLRQLANFSATTANKYDSAYVYYRVINNCNYYIAHRDTTLRNGSELVAMKEYAAVKALRGWAYMQLGRIYERVPFCTQPLTQISQIDDTDFPQLTLREMVDRLAPDLEQYTGYATPTYSSTPASSSFQISKILIPVDVVLGDMYLETAQYDKAIRHYMAYLTLVANDDARHTAYIQEYSTGRRGFRSEDVLLPGDWSSTYNQQSRISNTQPWSEIFTDNSSDDILSYIPFATNSQQGTATALPKAFGYDYYGNVKGRIDEIQISPSESYVNLSNSQDYYYFSSLGSTSNPIIQTAKLGDTRLAAITYEKTDAESDSTTVWVTKYDLARVILYRTSTVYLHLAEAFNRLGMYDVAFAILKDGISTKLLINRASALAQDTTYYVSNSSINRLFVNYMTSYQSKFTAVAMGYGVHSHGTGFTFDHYGAEPKFDQSPYQLGPVVGKKMQEIADTYGVAVGTTALDSINAVEDLLCDEYALELTFEGTRFYDLCRMARHKNTESPAGYGANFGGRWLARKLDYKQPVVDLSVEQNWYLPFK